MRASAASESPTTSGASRTGSPGRGGESGVVGMAAIQPNWHARRVPIDVKSAAYSAR